MHRPAVKNITNNGHSLFPTEQEERERSEMKARYKEAEKIIWQANS